jgi:molybdopterin synthase sulfur carrier subunit
LKLRVLYFAWVRELIGLDEEMVDRAAGAVSVRDLLAALKLRSDGHARAFADASRIRCALDQQVVPLDAEIGAAHEIAFFPPVTGG